MKRKQTHLKYGSITGLVMIAVYFVVYQTKLDTNPVWRYFAYLPFAIGIVINGIIYSRQNNAKVTYSKVFASCYKATIVVTVLSLLWMAYLVYFDPAMKEKYMEMSRQSMARNSSLSDEMMASNLAMMEKAYAFMMLFFVALYDLLAGLLFSLIGAGIAKKSPEQPFEVD